MQNESVSIATFSPADLAGVVRLLAASMPAERITVGEFTRRVLLDPNFDRKGAPVARSASGEAIGFLLAIARRRSLEDAGDDRDLGWITLFAVKPELRRQGIGSRLLAAGEFYLSCKGCAAVLVSPYAPGYWIPGVDGAAYPEAHAFLEQRGYETVSRPLSMSLQFGPDWTVPASADAKFANLRHEGIVVTPFAPNHALPLVEFLRPSFPGDWQRAARETMDAILAGRRPVSALWIAMSDERCVGFAQYEGERFGPIGVSESERGRGIGAALMYCVLDSMRREGSARAYFLWTNDATAASFYGATGFREVRRFDVFRKALSPCK